MQGVLDRLTLSEELGVGNHLDLVNEIGTLEPQDTQESLRGPCRDGRLLDHDRRTRQGGRDAASGSFEGHEARLAGGARWGAHAEEDHLCTLHGARPLEIESQASGIHHLLEEHLETRFEERADPLPESADLLLIVVQADHVVTDGREGHSRDQPHMTRTDDNDLHPISLIRGLNHLTAGD
jgi:hypothetical protein